MPVSHGQHKHIKIMTEAYQYFSIGEPFLYTPMADKKTTILIVPVKKPVGMSACLMCQKFCALSKWCGNQDNFVNGVANYIPNCHTFSRYDGEDVYFKEI